MASVRVDPNKVLEFKDEQSFYKWLGKQWDEEQEVWIKIYKVRSGVASITPTQAIDVVLCWGWIDGIRKAFDDKSFLQRYTPRGKKSVWSQINVANVERLTKAGRMQPSGLAQVAAAKADGRWQKAYSITKTQAPDDLLAAIRAEPKAFAMYEALSSQNRFALIFRTLGMKTAAGRKKKIAGFVEMLKNGKTVYPQGRAAPARTPRDRTSGQSVKGEERKQERLASHACIVGHRWRRVDGRHAMALRWGRECAPRSIRDGESAERATAHRNSNAR